MYLRTMQRPIIVRRLSDCADVREITRFPILLCNSYLPMCQMYTMFSKSCPISDFCKYDTNNLFWSGDQEMSFTADIWEGSS